MSSIEQPPEPDDFGMIPPQEEGQGQQQDNPFLAPREPGHQPLDSSFFKEGREEVTPPPYPTYPENEIYSLPENRTYSLFEGKTINYQSYPRFAGSESFRIKHNILEPAKPVEKPDPYPSRAGWRADYLPPYDPTAEEPKDKPKGKIGEYDIVESITTFDDIGGNTKAKDLLSEIAEQFEDPEHYAKWDVPIPKGVLLYGEPGTGKTMLAKAFANRANAVFIEVPVATLRDKYYGESEKRLKSVFDEAAKRGEPVVIFFDEIDSLLPDRSELHPNSPDSQIVNTFLQAMDGMSSAANIMVLGATNYPNRLDAAATRPGRFDRKVEVELPDAAGTRAIVAKQLLKAERSAKRALVEDNLDLEETSRYLEGLSGAAIGEIINRVKRTLAQTERAMKKSVLLEGEVEFTGFDNAEQNSLKITTDDIVATAITYHLEN